ncbi:hypothetical protein ASC74_24595 [Pseudomonas sp. Root329]|nr:hypothetical protein ASC74_24595 [Pseudomonas sp. Root329]
MSILRRNRDRREIFVEQPQVLDRFLELQVGLPSHGLIAIKPFHIHVAILEQRKGATVQRLGLFKHLTITFQGEGPAGFDFIGGGIVNHDQHLIFSRFLLKGIDAAGEPNLACPAVQKLGGINV